MSQTQLYERALNLPRHEFGTTLELDISPVMRKREYWQKVKFYQEGRPHTQYHEFPLKNGMLLKLLSYGNTNDTLFTNHPDIPFQVFLDEFKKQKIKKFNIDYHIFENALNLKRKVVEQNRRAGFEPIISTELLTIGQHFNNNNLPNGTLFEYVGFQTQGDDRIVSLDELKNIKYVIDKIKLN